MKVLIPFEFNRKIGGTQKAILEIMKEGKEVNSFCFMLPPQGDFDTEIMKENVPIFYSGNNNYWPTSFKNIKIFLKNIIHISTDLKNIVRENGIEVVYASMLPGLLAAIHAKKTFNNLKVIYHIRGSKISRVHNLFLRILLSSINYIVVNTEFTKKSISVQENSLNKIIVIPDSTDFHIENKNFKKKFCQDTINIGIVSRICRIKGHIEFVEIANQILERFKYSKDKKINFFIGGDAISVEDKEYLEEVKEKIKCYNLEKHIKFEGYIENVNDYLKNLDILFCTTQYPGEGFGKIVIEAQANYVPVVAFNYGSMSTVIRNKVDGFVVDDMEEFVASAYYLITDQNLRESMAYKGFEKVEQNYDSRLCNRQINELFES